MPSLFDRSMLSILRRARCATLRALGVTFLACATLLGAATTASATDPQVPEPNVSWPLNVGAAVKKDGTLHVTETFTWNLEEIKAPFTRTLPLFVPRSEQSWRKFEYSSFSLESDDADLTLTIGDDSSQLAVKIRLSDEEIARRETIDELAESSIHITFRYVVRGALSAGSPDDSRAPELFWAPLASGGTTRTELSFTYVAPTQPTRSECTIVTDDGSLLGWSDALEQEEEEADSQQSVPTPQCSTRGGGHQVEATSLNRYSTVIVRSTFPRGTVSEGSAISVIEPDSQSDDATGTVADDFDPTWSENIDYGLDQGTGLVGPAVAGVAAIALATGIWAFTRKKPDFAFVDIALGDLDAARALSGAQRFTSRSASKDQVKRVKKHLEGPARFAVPRDLPARLSGGVLALELKWNDISAMITSLAIRSHISLAYTPLAELDERAAHTGAQQPKPRSTSDSFIASSPHGTWTLSRTEGVDELSPSEKLLVGSVFDEGDEIIVPSLHAMFAPQLLEVLALVGQELVEQDLVTSPIDNSASRRAGRMQRTPLGRAYAEYLQGLAESLVDGPLETFTPGQELSADLFVQFLPFAIGLGVDRQWAALFDSHNVDFALPSWFTINSDHYVVDTYTKFVSTGNYLLV